MVDYKENATDGDDDGFVQDATPFERPIAKKEEPKVEKPAVNPGKEVTCVISKRNIYLPNVGRLIKGTNEIDPKFADRWLAVEGVEAC